MTTATLALTALSAIAASIAVDKASNAHLEVEAMLEDIEQHAAALYAEPQQ
jgi:hypothetical protein